MTQRQYDHITSFENGEPNDVDLAPWGRQPERVIVTLTGDKRDVHNVFMRLQGYLANQPFDLDYEVGNDQSRIILHPWAKND